MGGRKKLSIKQMEKRQLMKKLKERREEGRAQREKQETLLLVDENVLNNIRKEVVKSPCVTPSEIAIKYGIKVSTAKRILRELESEGLLRLMSRSRRLAIYTGSEAKVTLPRPMIPLVE